MMVRGMGYALLLVLLFSPMARVAMAEPAAFDHDAWNQLLKVYVHPVNEGKATEVDYGGMKASQGQLKQYLNALSAVSENQFRRWSQQEQLAFLINAYNAWTVELILTAWPSLESIRDLGSLFRSPWSKEFVPLLGELRSLDDIEHGLIRGSGLYQDPRIHFAVNCASIGCPALRAQAYEGAVLDRQLDEQTALFLADRSRNREEGGALYLSSIFKWYREDFEKGWQGYNRLEDFLLAHSQSLELSVEMEAALKQGEGRIRFLDYDWRLNSR